MPAPPPNPGPRHARTQAAKPPSRGWRPDWSVARADVGASLVVFLVAVPLSLGIAVASGAPILAGLIAAIVGGIVAGLLGGSPLQVSGPAAGLTVVVAELVTKFGWQVTTGIVAGAGLVQIGFGLSRLARFAQAIPPAVVHGMLAGIGGTIVLAQLHVVLGGKPQTSALENLVELPAQLINLHGAAVIVGLCTVGLVLGWPRLPGPLRAIPGPLVAVAVATGLSLWLNSFSDRPVPRVELPGGLLSAVHMPLLPSGEWGAVIGGVLTVALIASVESLLSAVAVDRMHNGPRTNADRELIGQGAANTLSGLLGGLPVTGVIVRSSTNVKAGARTRAAAVLHAVWIAVFALALVWVVESIPLAALAGLLVVVGVQLVKLTDLRVARQHGELVLYLVTALGVMGLNLLEGVGLGLALAAVLVLRRAVKVRIRHQVPEYDGEHRVLVEGLATFLCVPNLSRVLAEIPPGAPARLELATHYVDHAVRDHLDTWVSRQRASGAAVMVTQRGPGGRPPTAPVQPGPVPRRIGVRSTTERRFQQPVVAREPGR
ncbi:MAG TPA: SulP family inorganic anion transporter [Pseudonocardia sp.]|nr:SulP family inorganic anion transporter [Pseudonocardia sp.]